MCAQNRVDGVSRVQWVGRRTYRVQQMALPSALVYLAEETYYRQHRREVHPDGGSARSFQLDLHNLPCEVRECGRLTVSAG